MVPHYDELMSRRVADVMTEAVVHVDPTSPLTRVLELMVNVKARSFPVLNAARHLQGMISREELIRALRETTQAQWNVRRHNRAVLIDFLVEGKKRPSRQSLLFCGRPTGLNVGLCARSRLHSVKWAASLAFDRKMHVAEMLRSD
jgi:hypothetical protein